MCYFHKSCNVGTFYVIDISVRFSSVFYTLFMDVMHNLVQFFVHFLSSPAQMHCILAHFQS